jgi:secreted trypsin-like serine protease
VKTSSTNHKAISVALGLALMLPALGEAQTSKSRDWDPLQEAKEKKGGARISGGSPVSLAANAWQVALLHAGEPDSGLAQFCGGTVISRRWVLTAAHCADRAADPGDIAVLAGTANLKGGGRRFKVDKILVHEKWTRQKFQPDIALLRLVVDAGTSLGSPIELHTQQDLDEAPPPGNIVRITGWGITENRKFGTETLQGVEIPIMKHSECKATHVYGEERINGNVFCAGVPPKDTCRGDSGGPATMVVGGTRKLIGITSWGEGCGLTDKPGVYTNVARFVEWKDSKIAANGGH